MLKVNSYRSIGALVHTFMFQTSNFGQAYVIKGGLHQRSIAVVVEAYTTYFLNYDAQIYGV